MMKANPDKCHLLLDIIHKQEIKIGKEIISGS